MSMLHAKIASPPPNVNFNYKIIYLYNFTKMQENTPIIFKYIFVV
jgi:hypothetical protein